MKNLEELRYVVVDTSTGDELHSDDYNTILHYWSEMVKDAQAEGYKDFSFIEIIDKEELK